MSPVVPRKFEWSVLNVIRNLQLRGKTRLLNTVVPRTGERLTTLFGQRLRLDLSDHIQRWIYFGSFEPTETALVRKWLQPGMTVVDVGANIGYYTLLSAHCVGQTGQVFAVEPSPYAYDKLRDAVETNGLQNVTTLMAALDNKCGTGFLYSPPRDNHSPSMLRSDHDDGVAVAVTTLEYCLSQWKLENIDLLKVDVEGFEPQVLQGAESALRVGRIRALLCELNDWWLRRAGWTAERLYDFRQIGDSPARL
jgi:FkbM family methyltransferase